MASQTSKSWGGKSRKAPAGSLRQRIEKRSLLTLLGAGAVTVALAGWFAGLIETPSSRYGEAPPAPTINDYRVGSIVFVPVKGANCELYRFDNLTGGVAHDGTVNCDKKLNPAETDAFAPGTERRARMNSVLGGFRK